MCIPLRRLLKYRRYKAPIPCSCYICGKNFKNTEALIKHMGGHETIELNRIIKHGYGTVRCNNCWISFTNVEALLDHPCVQNAPVTLEKVTIYD
jgi:hypothetical protein